MRRSDENYLSGIYRRETEDLEEGRVRYEGGLYMAKKCSKCGGEMITGTLMANLSFHPLVFTPAEDINKIAKRKTGVICDACTQCGSIENMRVEDPDVLRA